MQTELIAKLEAEITRLRSASSVLSNLHMDAEKSAGDWRAAYFALLAETKEGNAK